MRCKAAMTGGWRRVQPALLAASAALAAASVGVSSPQPVSAATSTWTNSSNSGPAAQANPAMAWDQATGTDVLFTTSGETWTWNGSAWTKQTPATAPSPRLGAAMAYDAAHGVVVLFGGKSGSTFLNDTWTWNGSTWTPHPTTIAPLPRSGAAMGWDTAKARMILFGGYQDVGIFYGDTWMWDGTSWNEFEVNFVVEGAGPAPRTTAQIADDPANKTVVLFGGATASGALSDTWVWNEAAFGGAQWVKASPFLVPAARSQGTLAYASSGNAQAPILFGGVNAGGALLQDTWSFDGAGWATAAPAGQPPARHGAAMAAGPNGTVVMFGGFGGSGVLGDTWTWSGAADPAPLAAPIVNSCPAVTVALPTSSGTGTLRGAAAVSHPGFYIGASLTADALYDADVEQQITAGSQFNLIASSNQTIWSGMEKQPGIFDYCDADQFVGYAQAYHQALQLNNLITAGALQDHTPNWVRNPSIPWTAASLSAVMKQYITTTIDHFRGKVSIVDVVNEAIWIDGVPQDNVFKQVIGYPRYIEQAFQYAHDANPQATLLYDDFLDYYGPKKTTVMNLVNDLKASSYIDAVGFEMFSSSSAVLPNSGSPQSADLGTGMGDIAALGVKTGITQMTAPIYSLTGAVAPSAGSLTGQAAIYNYIMSACLNPVSNCFMYMVWGVSDTYALPTTAFADALSGALNNDPTRVTTSGYGGSLFDPAYQPRPAFNAVLSLLQ
jgi:GH35 family endo-1,4-beta-xylanase